VLKVFSDFLKEASIVPIGETAENSRDRATKKKQ